MRLHEGFLERQDVRHALHEEPVTVDEEEARAGLRLRQAVLNYGPQQQRADAAARPARAKHRNALLPHGHAGDVHGREERPGSDHRGALNVVIEGTQPITITLQKPGRVVAREVLPLQQDVRPALDDR